MQILPLLTTSDTSSSDLTASQGTTTGSRQSALFASLLNNYASGTETTSGSGETSTQTTDTSGNPLDAASAPSQEQLMTLKVTKEDIAALHDALQARGFSDTEINDLETTASSDTGMTWGDLMSAVTKKSSSRTSSAKKKDMSVDDQTQLLGLFGKLGFSTEQSQQLVDSLAKGDVDSVWSSVNAKIAALASDSTVSLNSTEISALARSMNLSDSAQDRLTKLFDQSTAEQGLSGDGLKTAFTLVQNERNAQLAQESQSLQDFREAASAVLTQAWQRNASKENSGIHEDDVARKAAQVVAMSGSSNHGKDAAGATSTAASTAKPQVDVLADVPETGQGVGSGTDKTKTVADGLTQTSLTGPVTDQATQLGRPAQTTQNGQTQPVAKSASAGSAKAAKAQAETAAATAGGSEAAQSSDVNLANKENETEKVGQGTEKTAAPTAATGTAANGFVQTSGSGGGATGGRSDQSGQSGKDDAWGEFWSKVRSEGSPESQSASGFGQTASQAGLAAMDGGKTPFGTVSTAATTDAGLAARTSQQLEAGLLRNLGQGSKQLTLTLQPDELGKLSVTLTVKGKEVQATITADNSDTAAMLQDQTAHIRQTLENQGFKVSKLDVQTGLAQDNQSAWQGPEQHNQAREQREAMDRLRSSLRLTQGSDRSFDVAQTANIAQSVTAGAQGLDLFA